MKKTMLASAMMMCFLSSATFAAEDEGAAVPTDQGHGVIKFVGAIIDAPCSIAPESVDQTIQMGQIANSMLENQGEGPLRPFEIHLEGCSIDTAKTATITFNGIPDDTEKKHLAINGFAKGAAIAMVSQLDGSDVILGTPTKAMSLVSGDNHLKFGAKLVSNVKSGEKATPGEFTATSDFIMSYQ
ncbi:type 1 fimbrial protein (plasmid) [Aeromonas sp. BC14]|uniref:fimbrial protein n=1 Tax=Aeromonas sp. DNRA1 TaxID=2729335 RepID=UPI001459D3B3|nr:MULTISPECIES: fimbrial protein [unclassified Aeromonas]NME02851.1 type 1 fimbrial protein [Aeromonas sp. DNRA1]WAF96931.1 type 1 fimbrial protein [Aeromonas sp. BC14]HDZ8965062.1 type 1 fimbrial protein [Aeromonas dhakensis]